MSNYWQLLLLSLMAVLAFEGTWAMSAQHLETLPVPTHLLARSRRSYVQVYGRRNANMKYFFIRGPLNWLHSRLLCEAYGGQLATVRSVMDQLEVTSLVNQNQEDGWVGLYRDPNCQHGFRWIDDKCYKPIEFNGWQWGQPDNNGTDRNQNCGALIQLASGWSDEFCEGMMGAVCERYPREVHHQTTPLPHHQHGSTTKLPSTKTTPRHHTSPKTSPSGHSTVTHSQTTKSTTTDHWLTQDQQTTTTTEELETENPMTTQRAGESIATTTLPDAVGTTTVESSETSTQNSHSSIETEPPSTKVETVVETSTPRHHQTSTPVVTTEERTSTTHHQTTTTGTLEETDAPSSGETTSGHHNASTLEPDPQTEEPLSGDVPTTSEPVATGSPGETEAPSSGEGSVTDEITETTTTPFGHHNATTPEPEPQTQEPSSGDVSITIEPVATEIPEETEEPSSGQVSTSEPFDSTTKPNHNASTRGETVESITEATTQHARNFSTETPEETEAPSSSGSFTDEATDEATTPQDHRTSTAKESEQTEVASSGNEPTTTERPENTEELSYGLSTEANNQTSTEAPSQTEEPSSGDFATEIPNPEETDEPSSGGAPTNVPPVQTTDIELSSGDLLTTGSPKETEEPPSFGNSTTSGPEETEQSHSGDLLTSTAKPHQPVFTEEPSSGMSSQPIESTTQQPIETSSIRLVTSEQPVTQKPEETEEPSFGAMSTSEPHQQTSTVHQGLEETEQPSSGSVATSEPIQPGTTSPEHAASTISSLEPLHSSTTLQNQQTKETSEAPFSTEDFIYMTTQQQHASTHGEHQQPSQPSEPATSQPVEETTTRSNHLITSTKEAQGVETTTSAEPNVSTLGGVTSEEITTSRSSAHETIRHVSTTAEADSVSTLSTESNHFEPSTTESTSTKKTSSEPNESTLGAVTFEQELSTSSNSDVHETTQHAFTTGGAADLATTTKVTTEETQTTEPIQTTTGGNHLTTSSQVVEATSAEPNHSTSEEITTSTSAHKTTRPTEPTNNEPSTTVAQKTTHDKTTTDQPTSSHSTTNHPEPSTTESPTEQTTTQTTRHVTTTSATQHVDETSTVRPMTTTTTKVPTTTGPTGCGSPGVLENGQVHVGGTTLGSARDVTCNDGYKMCGTNAIFCTAKGWTPLPTCVKASSKFFVIRGKHAWSDAEKLCNSQGARLAHVKNYNDHETVKQLAASATATWDCNGYWIGASAKNKYSPYLWSDNSSMTINGWATSQPDRKGCGSTSSSTTATMCVRIHQSGVWDDVQCDAPRMEGAICEKLNICL